MSKSLMLATLALFSCSSIKPVDPPFTNPTHEPRQYGAGPAITYVVMGDSTAAGQGAPYEDGIAVMTARKLGETHSVRMINLGISGAKATDVEQKELPEALSLHPDVVLLAVTANDVTHLTSAGVVRTSLQYTIRALRASNPQMKIVMTGSPDMGAPPRVPWYLRGIASLKTKQLNRVVRAIVADEHLTFAPIAQETGPLFRKDPSLFDVDFFHPNSRGYAVWIRVLNKAFESAL